MKEEKDEEDKNKEVVGLGTKDDPVPGESKGRTIIRPGLKGGSGTSLDAWDTQQPC